VVWRWDNGDNSEDLIQQLSSSFSPGQPVENEIPYPQSCPGRQLRPIVSGVHPPPPAPPTDYFTALIGQPRQFPPAANPPPPNHHNHPLPRRRSFAIWTDDDQRWPVSPHSPRNECRGRGCGDLDAWHGSFAVSLFAPSRLSISLGSGPLAAGHSSNSMRGPMDVSKASHGRCGLSEVDGSECFSYHHYLPPGSKP
jgi:hypothetical protein